MMFCSWHWRLDLLLPSKTTHLLDCPVIGIRNDNVSILVHTQLVHMFCTTVFSDHSPNLHYSTIQGSGNIGIMPGGIAGDLRAHLLTPNAKRI